MKYTTNYALRKPEGTDPVNIDDFNYNSDTMDGTIGGHVTNTTAHITSTERTTWNGKQDALGFAPLNKAGDTATGILVAQNNTSYTTKQIRNTTLSPSAPSGGSSGDLWFVYV